MRSLLFLLPWLAVGGCAERPLEAADPVATGGPDAAVCGTPRICTESVAQQKFALDGVCVSPTGDLEVRGKPLSLGFCHCLHGCGPGIDGAIELTIENHSTSSRALSVSDVYYTSTTSPPIHYEDTNAALPGLRRLYTCPGEPKPWDGRIASGATERVIVPQHFDVSGELVAGDYRLRVQLGVDGQLRWFELGTAMLPVDAHCQ